MCAVVWWFAGGLLLGLLVAIAVASHVIKKLNTFSVWR